MDPITRGDEELFGTVMVAARLGRAGPIVDQLRERYEREWDDPRAGFPYALALLALLQSGREDLRTGVNYTEIVETLSDLLYHEADHWLGRYLRIHTRTLLPVRAKEHQAYVTAERTRAAEDAAELIERQAKADWQPWFACPYILAARLAWEADDRDRVPALVSAAAARPGAPVPFRALGGLLCEAFIWYDSEPDVPERDTAGALMETLFGDQPAARRARIGRAA
jgi:hypothetical protein